MSRPLEPIAWREGSPAALAPWAGSEAAVVWVGRAQAVLAPSPEDLHDAARLGAAAPAFLARRAVARLCLARWLGLPPEAIRLAHDRHGRPCLGDRSWAVSLASRAGVQAVALARRPVGVDVEVEADASEPAWAMLAPAEKAALDVLAPDARGAAFLTFWTAKEAYLKALGLGLLREPAEIAVAAARDGMLAMQDRGRPVFAKAAATRAFTAPPLALRAACVVL